MDRSAETIGAPTALTPGTARTAAATVDAAVARARESFDSGAWRKLPAAHRAQVLSANPAALYGF